MQRAKGTAIPVCREHPAIVAEHATFQDEQCRCEQECAVLGRQTWAPALAIDRGVASDSARPRLLGTENRKRLAGDQMILQFRRGSIEDSVPEPSALAQ